MTSQAIPTAELSNSTMKGDASGDVRPSTLRNLRGADPGRPFRLVPPLALPSQSRQLAGVVEVGLASRTDSLGTGSKS
jgi:hypothetical protein